MPKKEMRKNIPATLGFIKNVIEQGRFRPLVDRKYAFDQIADAYRYVATGNKVGNVVLAFDV